MKFTSNVSEEKYNEFIKDKSNVTFLQTPEFGKLKSAKANRGIDYYLVGVENKKGELLAVATLLYFKKNKIKNIYCSRGPVADYFNEEIMTCFLEGLYKFAKKLKADVIDIEPDYIIRELDNKFDTIKEYKDISVFEKVKYKYRGAFGQIPGFQLRYTVVFDLNKTYEEIFAGYENDKKKIINRNNKYFKIKIVESELDTINDLVKFRSGLSKSKKFYLDDVSYYEKTYNLFNERYKAKYIRAIANFDEMITNLKDGIMSIEEKIKTSKNPKDLENQKASLEKKISEIKSYVKENNIKGDYCLGAGITLYVNGNVTYLYEHTDKNSNFGVPTLMTDYLLKDAVENKYRVFDFLGIINPKLKNTANMGVNNFKTSFGGEIIEHIGVFSRPVNKIYLLKKFAKKMYYKLRGRIYEE